MDTLHISGLGPPRITLNGRSVEIRRRKAVALLVYLTVEGRPQSREYLSGLFWPEYDQSRAYAYLRRTLWEIRDVLGDGWLEVDREWAGIRPSADVRTDVDQFHALIRAARDHDHPLPGSCDYCIDQLEAAVGLYRGDFLSGFGLSASPQFDDWQFLQSECMRRMFQEAIRHLVDALEQCGRVSEAIPYAQRWVALDNLDERAHRKLMALYAQDDQIHAALRQFELCRAVLETELDLAPEPETATLYHKIRERRTSSAPLEAGADRILLTKDDPASWLDQILALPVQVAFRTNLSVQTTPCIGRESEAGEISRLFQNPDCWLVTLTGIGGIGKTRLANYVGREISATFPHGVCFVSLEGLKSISALLPRVAESLGLSFHPQESSLGAQLNSFLRDKTLLIIFDNFDAFASEAGILHQLHAEAASVKFLVTSRERLNISGEWVIEVQGLDYPGSTLKGLDEILRFDAVELFVQAARRTLSSFQVDDGNYRDIVAITQLVEGMPLGLEMAASWVGLLSPEEILAEIRASLDFLRTEMRDAPVRQQSMRAVQDYSWKRLGRADRSSLARLSVFQGGFTRESAEKVAGAALSDLKRLMDRSFIRQKGSGRFHIHELLRQYGLERLQESSEDYRATKDRHAAYYGVALSRWGDGLKGPDQVELLPIMRQEIDNIETAWAWVTQSKQTQQIKSGLEGLCYFYLRTLRNQEGLKACQLGLSALEGAEAECGPEIRAMLLAWKSMFSLNLNDHEKAAEAIDAGLVIMHGSGADRKDAAPTWARLFTTKAVVENYLGNRERAIEYFDQAYELCHQAQDFSGFSSLALRALYTSGVASERTYRFVSAAIDYSRKMGDLFNTAYLLHTYGMVVGYHLGQPARAAALTQEGCELFEKLGDPLSREMSLGTVDTSLCTTGRYDELLEVREKKLAYARERGDRYSIGIYLAEVGETLGHLGRFSAAADHFREALALVKGGVPYQYAFRQCCFGEVLLVQDQIAESYDVFQESVSVLQTGELWGLGRALAGLSVAALKMGDQEQAREIVGQALQHHHDGHTYYFAHFSLGAYAYLLSRQGDSRTGIEIYSMLAREKFVRDSRWFNDLYRRPIYDAALKDHPDEITIAESIGKERGFWRALELVCQRANRSL